MIAVDELTVEELQAIVLADPAEAFDEQGRLLPLDRMPESVRRAISSIETFEEDGRRVVRLEFVNKLDALEWLLELLSQDPPPDRGIQGGPR